jgi:hypothetical protein
MWSTKFRMNLPSVEEVKNTDIVNYLESLGIKPSKISRSDFWFLSPFRDETQPSFKVNRNLNRWYDFGDGKGGNIIDFGILYHHCCVGDFLKRMAGSFSFQQQKNIPKQQDEGAKKITIINAKEISSLVLIRYLHTRRIPVDVAREFCKEIDYELYGKQYYAIGFKNNAGGYELRNEKFKASSSPKDVTLIKNHADKISVFEGFFNFLSYQAIHQQQEQPNSNFLILNSTSFFEKSLPVMHAYKSVHLYLDCDATGQKCRQKAMEIDNKKFVDESVLYKNYKDLNDWIVNIGKVQKQGNYMKP